MLLMKTSSAVLAASRRSALANCVATPEHSQPAQKEPPGRTIKPSRISDIGTRAARGEAG